MGCFWSVRARLEPGTFGSSPSMRCWSISGNNRFHSKVAAILTSHWLILLWIQQLACNCRVQSDVELQPTHLHWLMGGPKGGCPRCPSSDKWDSLYRQVYVIRFLSARCTWWFKKVDASQPVLLVFFRFKYSTTYYLELTSKPLYSFTHHKDKQNHHVHFSAQFFLFMDVSIFKLKIVSIYLYLFYYFVVVFSFIAYLCVPNCVCIYLIWWKKHGSCNKFVAPGAGRRAIPEVDVFCSAACASKCCTYAYL